MELHGNIALNLRYALDSATRLRGKQIHPDTLKFWRDLIDHAQDSNQRLRDDSGWMTTELIAKLESEISRLVGSKG